MEDHALVASYKAILERLSEMLSKLRGDDASEIITSSSISHFLDDARVSVSMLEQSNACTLNQVRYERQKMRMALQTVHRRATWLDKDARAKLADFIAIQPEFLDDEFRFTRDFSSNYIGLWPKLLGHLAGEPNLNFLEIGSFEGGSACWLLMNILTHDSSRLTCIDRFDELGLNQGLIDCTKDSFGMSVYERFRHNVNIVDKHRRVSVLKGSSAKWLRTLTPASVDFAYIDGSHMAEDVMQDAVLVFGVLKSRGILAFDDYCWTSQLTDDPLASPKPAIDAFLYIFRKSYTLLHHGKQVIIAKTSA